MELSDKIKEKLNDPLVIKGMAEHILIKAGKPEINLYFDGAKMGGHDDSINYFFSDFPNRNFLISGEIYLPDSLNELISPFNEEKVEGRQVLGNFISQLYNCEKTFASLSILYLENPIILNPNNFKGYHSLDIMKLFEKNSQQVFNFNKSQINVFKKGNWKNYLAQIYLSIWDAAEYHHFENGRKEFLL